MQHLPSTAYAVLGLLSFGRMSGYSLKQLADQSISHFYWSPARSQVYGELRRLAAEGYVTEERVEQEKRPDKRMYGITDTGRAALREWLESEDVEPDSVKNPTALRVFFGQSMRQEALLRLLRERLARTRATLERFKETMAAAGQDERHFYTALTVRAGILHSEADMEWAEESIQKIEARGGP